MALVLVSPSGDRRFPLDSGRTLTVGRDLACDVPILDQGVSRRHAELTVTPKGVTVVDLGSRNGTWVNGHRLSSGAAQLNDIVSFGSVKFVLLAERDAVGLTPTTSAALDGSATMIRERAMPSREQAVADIAGMRLARLVTIAQRLGGLATVDGLLAAIVDGLFQAFDADRVAILLPGPGGTMESRMARDRTGGDIPRPVPRAIASGVAERQIALLTHDALDDERTAGASVMQQAVRSAMAAPLLDGGRATLGVLYVDNLRDIQAFSEEDLDFLVAFAGIAAAAVEREAAAERLEQATRVRENFERYFTPQLAERIASETGVVSPGGDRRHVTVLFSDIRGFTAIAESLPPMEMAAQLNEYFGVMVECVFRHHGALDKFIGDALMAYWGAPVARPDDADCALAAAFDMQRELLALNAGWVAQGRPSLSVGIGLHSGEAFIGNIGSPRRLEYTLIGDTVNIASRVCSAADGNEVLVSETVRGQLTAPVSVTPRPEISPARTSARVAVWAMRATAGGSVDE
ncbi:MAG TPA: adenylate/guanylate cyclase domain-containing protein [Gemmatimonas sp.]|nr:adenylate/guanylate cyclase domain-containing protein [Gemmatimonas sp.]